MCFSDIGQVVTVVIVNALLRHVIATIGTMLAIIDAAFAVQPRLQLPLRLTRAVRPHGTS